MRRNINLLFAFTLVAMMLLNSCNMANKKASDIKSSVKSATTETIKKGKEYTSKYVCPEHCKGSGSDKPGKCSECGMDLVENKQ